MNLENTGMILNPNENLVALIRKNLENNCGYCTCAQPDVSLFDTLCPCKNLRLYNKCYCNLYIKKEKII